MSRPFARLRVLHHPATSGCLALAVIATATPTDIRMFQTATARTVATHQIATADRPSAHPAARAFAASVASLAVTGRAPRRSFTAPEALPAAGVLAAFWITAPHDARLPMHAFARGAAAAMLATSGFVKPAAPAEPVALATARLPLAKPEIAWPVAGKRAPASALLAYAPAAPAIEAPFEALMGDSRLGVHNTWRPRPRPDPDAVLGWLDGRALGQFAPGQHAWVTNPLPASVDHAKQQKCLAEGIYFEARSESETGQAAVAQVILNRVRNPTYPDTICDVVYQNKNLRNRCQFSFACDGIKDRVRSKGAWRTAQRIARDVTDGSIWLEEVANSTHYYAFYVRPGWAKRMIMADRIGAHLFYRTRYGGWS